jgi:ABC-type branched-subunit amino acid transport system ATPase component
VSGLWQDYVHLYTGALTVIAHLISPVVGSYRWGLAIVAVTVLVRTVTLPLSRLHIRALEAGRDFVVALRGDGSAELPALYGRATTPLKEPIVLLAAQLPFLVPLYFAIRDLTRAHKAMPFVLISHLGRPARGTLGGLVLILAIVSTSLRSTRATTAHLDNPRTRAGRMAAAPASGIVFAMHPFVSAFALSYATWCLYDRVQLRLGLRNLPDSLDPHRYRDPGIARLWRTPAPSRESVGDGVLLTCRRLEVAYDKVQVLFGVDMEIRRGEVLALLGTNGAGKSTLLRAFSGLIQPTGGRIVFESRDITAVDAITCAELGIAQVPGGRGIFPTLTVAENLKAAAWMYRGDRDYVLEATRKVTEMFPILEERSEALAGNMSGGEQQMLTLAMAFIARPKLLLVDELSLGLAPAIVEKLLGIIRAIHEQGTTIVLVEQSVNIALTFADRAYFLEKGEVRFSGPTRELLERRDLLRSVFLEGAQASADNATGTKRRRTTASRKAADELSSAPVLLDVENLSKHFGGIRAVDDVSFRVRKGEILGLIGPNGSGKTTVLDLISGFLSPDVGRISFEEKDVSAWSPDRRALAGLGRSFQDARNFPSLTTAENLAMGLERHLAVRDHLAAALHLAAVKEVEEDIAWTVGDLIDLMGLASCRDCLVSELSTGTRRIVDLAMTVAHNASVVLLDEPSSGIAQRETEALGPLLERIRDETQCAMLVIEHDMPMITQISDRMIALESGCVVAEGKPADVVRSPRVVESYLGADTSAINRSGAMDEKRKAPRKRVATKTRKAR